MKPRRILRNAGWLAVWGTIHAEVPSRGVSKGAGGTLLDYFLVDLDPSFALDTSGDDTPSPLWHFSTTVTLK